MLKFNGPYIFVCRLCGNQLPMHAPEASSLFWGTMEQYSAGWRDIEAQENFGVQKWEESHLLEGTDVWI
jgi:hypothetical protein